MKPSKTKYYSLLFIIIMVASSLAACGTKDVSNKVSQTSQTSQIPQIKEPVDIVFYSPQAARTQDQFMNQVGNDIKEKFPNANLKFVEYGKGTQTADVVASGQPIDIIMSTTSTISELTKYGLQYDISELIKKYNYDLNRFEPTLIQFMKDFAGGGLYGLPTSTDTFTLFYNKNLFDKFGVPYPKDGMTWDDIYELAKKMTREENGVQLFGLATSIYHMLANNPLSVPYYDSKTNRVTIEDDKFKLLINNFARFYQLTGPQFADELLNKYQDLFKKDQRAAMYAFYGVDLLSNPVPFDWDVISMPYFKEAMGVAPQYAPSYFNIANTSTHKDQAFAIIAYLTSDEYQMKKSKEGKLTSLKSLEIRKAFAQNQDAYKGKNLKPYAPEKPALITSKDQFNTIASQKTTAAFKEIITAKKDINSALRDAAESAKKDIEAARIK